MTKAAQDLMVEVERVRDAFHRAVFVALPWLCPGWAATHREVSVPVVSVVTVRRARVVEYRQFWDLRSLERQLGVGE